MRVLGNKTIVTNGDQTDTIYEALDHQFTFEQGLRARKFEPDAPNYTPRISGIIRCEKGSFNYALSILKSAEGGGQQDSAPEELSAFGAENADRQHPAEHAVQKDARGGQDKIMQKAAAQNLLEQQADCRTDNHHVNCIDAEHAAACKVNAEACKYAGCHAEI